MREALIITVLELRRTPDGEFELYACGEYVGSFVDAADATIARRAVARTLVLAGLKQPRFTGEGSL